MTDEISHPITMDKRVDLALAGAVVATGLLAIWMAHDFRIGKFPDPLTSRGVPYIAGGALVAGGALLGFRRLSGWRDLPGHLTVSEGTEDEAGHPASSLRAFAIMACAFVWAALLVPAGYLIATPLCLCGMMWAMRVRAPLRLIGFPVGFTLVTWVIFAQMLNVLLPLGPLAPLARRLGLMY